ncbi:hypothetical protein [Levilactobacillus brevis]|uniref:hypothetical protein n=1 Tax=Levilactobacillus brevis TaxID=1580 RepID=UPI000A20B295|nr:hypothetical protein [Levilactobacillus brevis]ARN92177.1 hypothetical protein AZI11_04255 [Levilactobacillus brevis]ARN94871.1 hypothetical protein AZI12_04280 [Levilactobacillus brevis]MCT3597536.1 hypothetical protein [Levilactobacillus brevis]
MSITVKLNPENAAQFSWAYSYNQEIEYEGSPCYVTGMERNVHGDFYAQLSPTPTNELTEKQRKNLFAEKFIWDTLVD